MHSEILGLRYLFAIVEEQEVVPSGAEVLKKVDTGEKSGNATSHR